VGALSAPYASIALVVSATRRETLEKPIKVMTNRNSPSPARSAAFRILREVTEGQSEPASLLHGEPTKGLTSADHDLTTEIVYGVLRWQNRLDYILEARASRSTRRIDLPILLALRIGLYQVLFLDRVPQRAAVDEAVKIARHHGPRGAQGFVNGILRAVCRNPNQPVLPDRDGDPLRYLTITLSHPEWLAQRYLDGLGLDGAEARCRFHNAPAPVDLRVEPTMSVEEAQEALQREGIETERFTKVPRCLRVRKGKPTRSTLHLEGSIFIQEAGSQLIPHLLAVRPGDQVLDACAAPGAKATELSRWARPGLVIALELRPRRLKLLAAMAERLNCENLIPLGGDAGALPLRGSFRTILLDAPCSNLGTLARNPDIKWRVREKDLADLASRQNRLLTACAEILDRGGRLVYSTCSTEPEENHMVIQRFLDRHKGFRIAPPPEAFPAEARGLLSSANFLTTLPERDQMDGYFAAILQKDFRG